MPTDPLPNPSGWKRTTDKGTRTAPSDLALRSDSPLSIPTGFRGADCHLGVRVVSGHHSLSNRRGRHLGGHRFNNGWGGVAGRDDLGTQVLRGSR